MKKSMCAVLALVMSTTFMIGCSSEAISPERTAEIEAASADLGRAQAGHFIEVSGKFALVVADTENEDPATIYALLQHSDQMVGLRTHKLAELGARRVPEEETLETLRAWARQKNTDTRAFSQARLY